METIGVGVLCAICTLILKETKSPLSQFIPVIGGILLLLTLFPRLSPLVDFVRSFGDSLPEGLFTSVGKILAAGVLCSFGADLCTELGSPTLGARLLLVGKIEIFLLALPVLTELLSRVEALFS